MNTFYEDRPISLYTDHEALTCIWDSRKKLSHGYYRYQLIMSQFQNSKIYLDKNKNVFFLDLLRRNITIKEFGKHQQKRRKKRNKLYFTIKVVTKKMSSYMIEKRPVTIFFKFFSKRDQEQINIK